MFRKLFSIAVLFQVLTISAIAEDEKPVVIAMPPFCDFSNCIGTAFRTMALRDKVTAELFQKYNCIILSRSNGLTLSRENELSNIKQMDKTTIGSAAYVPAADYSVNGYVDVRKKNGTGNTLGGVLFVNDLENDTEKNWKKYETQTDEVDDIVSGIAKALDLKPKKKKYQKHENKIEETWAVLPIRKLLSDESLSEPSDKHLAMMIELSLQNSGKLKHIVDHNDIDKILRELKISSLNSATESVAGGISKLVGADKVVMGTVCKFYYDYNFYKRLDLFLVDGKTTLILDAVTADDLPLDADIEKIASDLVLKFTERRHPVPVLEKADPRLLAKECALYEEILFNFGMKNVKPDFVAKYIDTIYLLSNKDNYKKYKLGCYLGNAILPDSMTVFQQDRKMSLDDKKVLLNSMELLLKDIEAEGYAKSVLLLRAKGYLAIDDIETAMKLIDQHSKKHPDFLTRYANSLIAACYFKKKDYAKVLECLDRASGKNIYGWWVRAWTYLMLDNPEDDEEELDNLKNLKIGYRFHEPLFIAKRIALTRKIDGSGDAIDFVNKRMVRARRTLAEIQLELAKAYLAKGDKRAAKMIVDGINKENEEELGKISFYNKFETKEWLAKLHKEIKTLAEELNSVKYEWWELTDVVKIPPKYKIYIRPLGNPNKNMVNACAPIIEEKLGCKVEVLPNLPIPEDPYCFYKARGQYDCSHVWNRCRKAQAIPKDALMIVNVTEKNTFFGGWNYQDILSWYPTGEYSVSIHHWGHVGNYESILEVVAKAVLWCFNTQATNGNCQIKNCLFSTSTKGLVIKEKKYAICDTCKERLKKIDIPSVVRDFHDKYNRPISYGRNNKEVWQDKYSAIVKEALLAAEKEDSKTAISAIKLNKVEPGLTYRYYEFEPQGCKKTEHLDLMTPSDSGVIESFNLSKIKREHFFGANFEGYIKIPRDGKYNFYLKSDDGSILLIDDKEVINNDRRHSPRTYTGSIKLKAGYHSIRVPYFQAAASPVYTLKLYYNGPGIFGQEVPSDILFH